ncbi:hypothetical protein L3Q82_016182 [Scortum barcoo]|uniref:Uncharacterized protein n=1 Tax=Scortum barcoo TaxID=214431 RepID=A0ACB8VQI5_9TELE|nr:hypothetical protein L3Q82_016182 [Scortum barcoo]
MAARRRPQFAPFIALFCAFFSTGSSTAQVPALIWSSDGLPPLASPAAGHIMTNDQLTAYLTSAIGSGPHTVLLFLQDKLFKDDFTVFGGVFGNKQDSAFQNLEAALQSSSSSVTLPALECIDTSVNIFILSNLLLINLPYCTNLHKSCKEVLRNNDEIVGKVLSIMKEKNVPYTAIYTGLQPSRVISETSVSNQPVGRSLLQAVVSDVKPPIIFNTSTGPCIMLWAQNLSVSLTSTSAWIDLGAQTPTLTGSMCNGSSSLLVLNYASGFTLSFVMSRRFYPVSARHWFTLDWVQLQFGSLTASFIGSRSIYAPAEYSFHCQSVTNLQNALLVPNNTNSNTTQWRLNFIDFQIQGFGLANSTDFSYASDCAGFFTAGIWMGLLTSLLMLLIFVYGLHMIMQLNTMDRFDDPKVTSSVLRRHLICIIYARSRLPWLRRVKTRRRHCRCTRSFLFVFAAIFYSLQLFVTLSSLPPKNMSAAPAKRLFVFGSSQERTFFPFSNAPDRMGNQMAQQVEPHMGPGCYDNHEFGTIVYDLQKTPCSKRGYGLSARTAARFPPCSKTVTPSPQKYQQDQTCSRVPPPSKTPFNSTGRRFKSLSCTAEDSPGPGYYAHDAVTNRKVSWPMCFGRPDWSGLPNLEKKSLRVKVGEATFGLNNAQKATCKTQIHVQSKTSDMRFKTAQRSFLDTD